jgi:hypothetical protein
MTRAGGVVSQRRTGKERQRDGRTFFVDNRPRCATAPPLPDSHGSTDPLPYLLIPEQRVAWRG